MTKIILRVLCQEHSSVWAPGGAPRRHEGGACYWAGLVICDRAAWQSHGHRESFSNLLLCREVQAALRSSPPPQPGDAEISHRHCTHTASSCAWATAETNSEAPFLMDFKTNLDLKSTGKTSLFLPVIGDKGVHSKRRAQHRKPDGRNCVWKLAKEVPLTDTALYKCYLSRRENSKHCLPSLLTETFPNGPCNSALVKRWWL